MKVKKKWLIALILVAILLLIYCSQGHMLYIMSDKTIVTRYVRNGDQIQLSYLHSLYKTIQTENFSVRDFELCLNSMVFGDLNSLYYYDEQNLNYLEEDGKIYLDVEDQIFEVINIKANYSKTHSLNVLREDEIINNIEISDIFPSGTHLEMGVASYWETLIMLVEYCLK